MRAPQLEHAVLALAITLTAPLAWASDEAEPAVQSLAKGTLSAEQASGYATGLLLVFVVLGLLFVAARWLQSRGGQGRGGLRVQACLGLGGKERLMVVNAEGERLLIGVAPGGVQLIRVLETEAGDAEPFQAVDKGSWLSRTLSGDRA